MEKGWVLEHEDEQLKMYTLHVMQQRSASSRARAVEGGTAVGDSRRARGKPTRYGTTSSLFQGKNDDSKAGNDSKV